MKPKPNKAYADLYKALQKYTRNMKSLTAVVVVVEVLRDVIYDREQRKTKR